VETKPVISFKKMSANYYPQSIQHHTTPKQNKMTQQPIYPFVQAARDRSIDRLNDLKLK